MDKKGATDVGPHGFHWNLGRSILVFRDPLRHRHNLEGKVQILREIQER